MWGWRLLVALLRQTRLKFVKRKPLRGGGRKQFGKNETCDHRLQLRRRLASWRFVFKKKCNYYDFQRIWCLQTSTLVSLPPKFWAERSFALLINYHVFSSIARYKADIHVDMHDTRQHHISDILQDVYVSDAEDTNVLSTFSKHRKLSICYVNIAMRYTFVCERCSTLAQLYGMSFWNKMSSVLIL